MTEPFQRRGSGTGERPRHPTRAATLLMIAVVVLLVAAAALSTWAAV